MDHRCFDCPVFNITARELLHASTSPCYCQCTSAEGAVLSTFFMVLVLLLISFVINVATVLKKKCRPWKVLSYGSSDQQNEGRGSDAVDNEARVALPEIKQNEAYAGGLTGGPK